MAASIGRTHPTLFLTYPNKADFVLSKIYKIDKPSSLTSGLVQVTDFNVLPNVTPLRNALTFGSIRPKRTTGFSGRSFWDDDTE